MGTTAPPRMLGRYALYDKIASGGMASVHIGRLVGPVGFARTVAIKRMHTELAEDPEFVSMFLDEARVAARIRHPNVVPTLDVVALRGELFLVMDFVHGESLARLIKLSTAKREHVHPAVAATLLAGVLHGLHAAHEAKSDRGEPLEVVHRDVSPHNVLVGVDGVARVFDFGVAKAVGRLQTTRNGQLKGKIPYMAPEQLRGTVSRAADVYSASVVLWETLTGRRLFQGESEAEVFGKVLDGATDPPSRFAPGLPPALDAITMRGLALQPADRFATAREMACALEDVLAPIPASRIGAWVERAAKEALDVRSGRIADIESDTSVIQTVDREAADMRSGASVPSSMSPSAALDDAGIEQFPTQLSSGSVSASRSSVVARMVNHRAKWVVVGVLGAGLLVGVVAIVAGTSSSTPENEAPAAAAPAGPTETVAPATPPPAAASPPAQPVGLPTAIAPRPPAVVPQPSPPRIPPPRPANAPPSRPTVSCDPPYTINAAGHRVRKPECF